MQNIIKSWFKYFLFVGFFGVCINLIYLAIPVYMMVVYDRVLFSFSTATLFSLSLGVLISLIMMGLLDYFRMEMLGQAGNNLVQKMMPFVVKSMHADAVGSNSQGYTRGLSDLERLREAIVRGDIFYILDLPWVLMYLGLLYFVHPLVGIAAMVGVFLVTVFQMLLKVIEKKRYTMADVAFQANADFMEISLHHAQVISGMGMLSAVLGKYTDKNKKVLAARSGADSFQSKFGALIRLLQALAVVAVFTAGAFAFFTDEIRPGVIFASVLIMARIFYPFERSLSGMKTSIEAMAAYTRLKQFVNTGEEKTRLSLPSPEGRFDGQGIGLALNGRNILHNISFALAPGETLGILGPSSAGKTSLCKVLLGILPAMAGKVRLDGAELAQWPPGELGRFLGYLPQETALFPGTVADNISRLLPVDSEKVIRAAQNAGVHEMILKLAQGYDTKIDQTGKNFSAGQRQLISLARALYDDPKLVVLDEPHTHLDDLGLQMVFKALGHLKQEKITTIMVTAQPQLLMNMDKILVIKDGQVSMYGPGKEVIDQLTNRQQPQQAAGV